jgi:hypothetical protein
MYAAELADGDSGAGVAVLVHVSLAGFEGVNGAVMLVSLRKEGVMGSLFVTPALVKFLGLFMMVGGLRKVLCGVMVVLRDFQRHV